MSDDDDGDDMVVGKDDDDDDEMDGAVKGLELLLLFAPLTSAKFQKLCECFIK